MPVPGFGRKGLAVPLFALCCLLVSPGVASKASSQKCVARSDSSAHLPPYTSAADAHVNPAPGPPSATRSRNGPGYALIAPDSRVFGEPPRGWSNGATAAAVVTPALGAHFAMYLVRVPRGGRVNLRTVFSGSASHLQRFFFLLTGAMARTHDADGTGIGEREHSKAHFESGSFIFVGPGNVTKDALVAVDDAALIRECHRSAISTERSPTDSWGLLLTSRGACFCGQLYVDTC
jgi:hypothetical protein